MAINRYDNAQGQQALQDTLSLFVTSVEESFVAAKNATWPPPERIDQIVAHQRSDGPSILLFPPHPDDPELTGGFPFRAQGEARAYVLVVPVTLGSDRAYRPIRRKEQQDACGILGFDLCPVGDGFDNINMRTRHNDPIHWSRCVEFVSGILDDLRPDIVVFPYTGDVHRTHVGASLLVTDALASAGVSCLTLETEYWRTMSNPNLLVELSADDVATLVRAVGTHSSQVERNPFHLRLVGDLLGAPRRAELLPKRLGGLPPDFTFGMLYRLRRFIGGEFVEVLEEGRYLSCQEDIEGFLASLGVVAQYAV